MIKQLEIENFRCFGKSTLSGFERVNLIGGQNNSGKTAFLEALYLNQSPLPSTVMKLRGINEDTIRNFPERAWNSLFLNYDKELSVKIVSVDENNLSIILLLSVHDSSSEIARIPLIRIGESHYNSFLSDKISRMQNINTQDSFISSSNVKEGDFSALRLVFYRKKDGGSLPSVSVLIAPSGKTIMGNELPYKFDPYTIRFITTTTQTQRTSTKYLAEQYEKCYLSGNSERLKAAFHIIDPTITEIRTLTVGSLDIYLSRKNQRPMSIALFGDAMNRVAHFALELINNQAGILLVDEIENGIHHSHQKQLWQWLFALAVELDVQIFATTHSLEMLTAFKEAAMGTQYESEVAYFEFARHVKTGEIIGIKHQIDELDYALSHDGEIRGE